uniref:Uncharacterized protein n=1 Tax=Catharus ustulatus TaxID=91951 RepID=A0A8C3Y7E5_CATUS
MTCSRMFSPKELSSEDQTIALVKPSKCSHSNSPSALVCSHSQAAEHCPVCKHCWILRAQSEQRALGAGIGLQIRNLENHLAFLIPLSGTISFVFQHVEEFREHTPCEKSQGFLHRAGP